MGVAVEGSDYYRSLVVQQTNAIQIESKKETPHICFKSCDIILILSENHMNSCV